MNDFSATGRAGAGSRSSHSIVPKCARVIKVLALAALIAAPVAAQQSITLADAVAMAQKQGFQAKSAEGVRDAAQLRYRAFTASLLPQLSLGGSLPVYNRSIIPVIQPDGSTLFRPQEQNTSQLTMTLSQRLPFTGGELYMNSSLQRVQVLGEHDSRNWNSTPFLVGIRQDLLRSNSASWDARERDLGADVADRQYLETREDIAAQTTNAFFDYYAAQVALRNAGSNVATNDSLFLLNQGRFEVGKIAENDLLQSELALLRVRNALDAAKLEHDRTLAYLRLQLNLPAGTPLEIIPPTTIPEVVADTAVAVAEALRNRSTILNSELQGVTAARRVSEARYNSGFGASINASMGFNQSGSQMNSVYQDLREAQTIRVDVSMPILKWGGRSATIQAARADASRAASDAEQSRQTIIQEAHFAALQLPLAFRQLQLAAKGDTVGQKRFEVANNRYQISKITITELFQAQNEKDQALVAYVQALRGYWTAYYRLRRLTLFDFETGRAIR
jgi:outer membrane protein TolC